MDGPRRRSTTASSRSSIGGSAHCRSSTTNTQRPFRCKDLEEAPDRPRCLGHEGLAYAHELCEAIGDCFAVRLSRHPVGQRLRDRGAVADGSSRRPGQELQQRRERDSLVHRVVSDPRGRSRAAPARRRRRSRAGTSRPRPAPGPSPARRTHRPRLPRTHPRGSRARVPDRPAGWVLDRIRGRDLAGGQRPRGAPCPSRRPAAALPTARHPGRDRATAAVTRISPGSPAAWSRAAVLKTSPPTRPSRGARSSAKASPPPAIAYPHRELAGLRWPRSAWRRRASPARRGSPAARRPREPPGSRRSRRQHRRREFLDHPPVPLDRAPHRPEVPVEDRSQHLRIEGLRELGRADQARRTARPRTAVVGGRA